ncbi:MAG: hypothetical protein AB7N65_01765 [Vicinamibacterales bacterium]
MLRRWSPALTLGISIAVVGCGGGESGQEAAAREIERGAAELERAASNPAEGAEAMAKGLESMAKGLGAMAGGDPNVKPVDPVSFRDLMALFPESFDDWERSKPTGQRMASPVTFSEAEVRFRKDDASLTLKITDSGLNQLLIAPFSMFLTAGYEKETEKGYEKSVKVGDYPGWEEWNEDGRDGELNAIVDKRFMVQIEGRNIDGPSIMHKLAAATDLKKLSGLQPAAK